MTLHMVAEDMVIQATVAALSVVVVVSDLRVEEIEDITGILEMMTTTTPLLATTMVNTTIMTTTAMARRTLDITTTDITTTGILMGPIIKKNQIRIITAVW